MLQLSKNGLVTTAAREQAETRQLELDWYTETYGTITSQAAMLAGFAFTQLTTPMPEEQPAIELEWAYLVATCTSIGLELVAIVLSTFLSVWAPSLAIRGKGGTSDLHRAVDTLRDYQEFVFLYFILGWFLYFVSSIMQVWIYFPEREALMVTPPMCVFILLIAWYSYDITRKLRVPHHHIVQGRIDAFHPYEFVGDIDHGLHTEAQLFTQTGEPMEDGYCPIHENRTMAAGSTHH